MEWIASAGVWITVTTPAPCTYCGALGDLTVHTEATDSPGDIYCTLNCWGADMDQRTVITGAATNPRLYRGRTKPWATIAAEEPDRGPPGIMRHTHAGIEHLTYRDRHGTLLGVLHRSPAGEIGVWVEPDHQGQGIGTALTRAAGRTWGIDLRAQRFTPAGLAMARRALPPNRTI